MARRFNGTSNTMETTANVDMAAGGATASVTIAFWLWWDVFGQSGKQVLEHSTTSTLVAGAFRITPDVSLGKFGASQQGVGTVTFDQSLTSANQWHHYLFVLSPLDVTTWLGYLDGSSIGLTVTLNSGTSSWRNDVKLYFMHRGSGPTNFGPGALADVAIWSGDQSAYASTLASGVTVANLGVTPMYSWPILGTEAQEPATNGDIPLTFTGSTFDGGPFRRNTLSLGSRRIGVAAGMGCVDRS